MSTNEKVSLYKVPVPSTSFLREAVWNGAEQAITFTYESEEVEGSEDMTLIRFRRPMLIIKRAESFCALEHIEGCYDTLVEIKNSSLLREHQQHIQKAQLNSAHHYMIYLEGVGNFELIAESWIVEKRPAIGGERSMAAQASLPEGWTLAIEEVSVGFYRGTLASADGRKVEASAIDPIGLRRSLTLSAIDNEAQAKATRS